MYGSLTHILIHMYMYIGIPTMYIIYMCIVFNTHMHLQGFQLKHILHESNLDSNQTEQLMKVHDLNIQCALREYLAA